MFYIFSIHLSLRSKWFQQLNDIRYVAPSHYDIKLIFWIFCFLLFFFLKLIDMYNVQR